jgi:hypothetical protein
MCAQAYLPKPSGFLEQPGAKQQLLKRVMGDRIPEYICRRPKVRAQSASASQVGGTLGVLAETGVTEQFLMQRWCKLSMLKPKI